MNLPPGPRAPAIVQMLRWMAQPFAFLDACAARHGPTFTLRFPAYPPLVLFSDPDAVREIFADGGDRMHAGKANVVLAPFLGARSLLLLDGAEHRRQRRLLLPPFHGERMQAYGRTMVDVTHRSIDQWPRGEVFPIHRPMQAITLEVIIRTVFGMEDPTGIARISRVLAELLDLAAWPPLVLPWMQRDLGPWSPWGRFRRKAEQGDRLLDDEIRRRREEGTAGRTDVLSLLLDARDEQGEGLSDTDLRDQLVTLLVAGHETTATALAWTFRWLLADPALLARVRDEVAAASPGGDPVPEQVAKCELLDGTVRESLRLQPVIPLVGRVLQVPVTVGGWSLPAGVAVLPVIYLAHRRRAAFPEPERFDPTRFAQGRFAASEWFPFGGGVRRCIGMAFSLYEMKMVLATVLARVSLRAAAARVRAIRRSITLSPSEGMPVVVDRIAPRERARAVAATA